MGQRTRQRLLKAVGLILLLPGLAWVLMPTVWMISASFSTLEQVMRFPPDLIPHPWVWTNFIEGFTFLPFGRYFWNSTQIAVIRVIGQVFAASLAGYAFARLRAPDRDILFVIVLSTMMLPYTVTMIPQFVIFKTIGWIDSFKPLIVPFFGGGAFFIFLFRQFFRSLPEDIFEAARLDGCSYFSIYWRILMPLSMPVTATSAILIFQNSWQNLLGPLIYLNSNDKYTIPLGLATFRSSYGASPWNLIMAVSIVAALPPILLFFFGQRYLLSGIVVTQK
ncbi:MAG: carbohydrate ABC transporter permease [Anaerolineae bacterium]|nr:carbohydrate ABC transporter permease [Anaerolineae bacterium]